MKLRIAEFVETTAPLAGGPPATVHIEVSMFVPDDASDEEIEVAGRRLAHAHRVASIGRYRAVRQMCIDNGVDPDATPEEQLRQANGEAERRGGLL